MVSWHQMSRRSGIPKCYIAGLCWLWHHVSMCWLSVSSRFKTATQSSGFPPKASSPNRNKKDLPNFPQSTDWCEHVIITDKPNPDISEQCNCFKATIVQCDMGKIRKRKKNERQMFLVKPEKKASNNSEEIITQSNRKKSNPLVSCFILLRTLLMVSIWILPANKQTNKGLQITLAVLFLQANN